MANPVSHFVEYCLGLPRDFLQQHGDWSIAINPVWPKVPLIEAGAANWLLGFAVVAALLWLLLRPPARSGGGMITTFLLSPLKPLLSTGLYGWFQGLLQFLGLAILVALLLSLLSGVAAWNIVLSATIVLLVVLVYRVDGRSTRIRVFLGTLRLLVLSLVLFLLNRPMVALGQSRTEPSVLAVLIDDSSSMGVPDMGNPKVPVTRLAAVDQLLAGDRGHLLAELSKTHAIRIYKFDNDAQAVSDVAVKSASARSSTDPATDTTAVQAATAISQLQPVGQSTQVLPSILTTLTDLQGQRLAGVVLFTDGRDTPARNIALGLDQLKNFGVKVFPVAVGSDNQPRNIEVQSMQLDDVAFKGDVVNVKASVRASGYESGHAVHVVLKDKATGLVLPDTDGRPAEKTISVADDKPVDVELQWKTSQVGNREVVVEAVPQPGELDVNDNQREMAVSVLDAKVTVLFVDGYPRWDYRYLKNALIRDKTMQVSCLLASADANFLQEGNKPLPSATRTSAGHFPDTIEQLREYDVIIVGDVDPRFFSDTQLQLINEFVNRGGGFEMVAGPRYAPQAYRNTPIEPLLPVTIGRVQSTDASAVFSEGFRPLLTKAGEATGIYRFFADADKNARYLRDQLPEVYWYCSNVSAKPSVGEVLAEHPVDSRGVRTPILVAGRFGGRTLFSGIDDSWRWRLYTGESVFDTYWVQQIRYLARNRKIGQRRITLSSDQPSYELGSQVQLTLRVIDPQLLRQLPDQLRVQVNDSNGNAVRTETLLRQDGSGGETFAGSFTADKVGKYMVELPAVITGVDAIQAPIAVSLPRLELNDPRVDRIALSRLASETLGKPIDFNSAASQLLAIPSVEKRLPLISSQPIWNAPITMVLFVLLISGEWITRKMYGMV